jgi:hypothetical protein
MGWRTAWKALSDRIEGLLEAGRFSAQFSGFRTQSQVSIGIANNILWPDAVSIFEEIKKYKSTYEQYLFESATKSITRFISSYDNIISTQIDRRSVPEKVIDFSTGLASFRSEFTFHLSNMQEVAKRITERAFIHLQRLIIADEEIQNRWRKAFEKGEPVCEKLGAAHLLSHGIWAFKAEEKSEQTDLILGEPIRTILTQVESTAEALVLTEWKKVSPRES